MGLGEGAVQKNKMGHHQRSLKYQGSLLCNAERRGGSEKGRDSPKVTQQGVGKFRDRKTWLGWRSEGDQGGGEGSRDSTQPPAL